MKPKIFIDGEHGTTGLQIRTRLAGRDDIEIISVPAERRKDAAARAEFLNAADVAILCLPDDAAQGERLADRQRRHARHRRLDRASRRRRLGLRLCRDGQGPGARRSPRQSASPTPAAGRKGRSRRCGR